MRNKNGIIASFLLAIPMALSAQNSLPVTYHNPPLPPAPQSQSIMPTLSTDGTTAVKPINNIWTWATINDYPSLALRMQLEGRTGALLTVSPAGLVTACSLVQSSGVQMLDEITCAVLSRRARFSPALNADGKPMEGSHHRGVQWRVPKEDGDAPYQSQISPMPLSDPAGWVSPNPWNDTSGYKLRVDEKYTITMRLYKLSVDESGRVSGCDLVPTGRFFHPQAKAKDGVTCLRYKEAARFDSLLDVNGKLVLANGAPFPYPSTLRIYYAHIPAKMLSYK